MKIIIAHNHENRNLAKLAKSLDGRYGNVFLIGRRGELMPLFDDRNEDYILLIPYVYVDGDALDVARDLKNTRGFSVKVGVLLEEGFSPDSIVGRHAREIDSYIDARAPLLSLILSVEMLIFRDISLNEDAALLSLLRQYSISLLADARGAGGMLPSIDCIRSEIETYFREGGFPSDDPRGRAFRVYANGNVAAMPLESVDTATWIMGIKFPSGRGVVAFIDRDSESHFVKTRSLGHADAPALEKEGVPVLSRHADR